MMILEEFSGSTDQLIVKGKRTKRRRPSPSISSSSGGGEFHNSVFNFSSPSYSNYSTCTEEDEDMANCLILLARGESRPQMEEEIKSPENKFIRSRKFTEMPTTTDGKIGIYVYECKTCNRTFSSFQALGGHRASHKRPKLVGDIIDRRCSPPPLPPVKKEGQCTIDSVIIKSALQSTQLRNKTLQLENKPKIHECSVCGSEFGSGQALGGHMRRHRAVANANTRIGSGVGNDTLTDQKQRNMLALDLNLPASPEGGEISSPPRHWWIAASRTEERLVENI